jgi:integrase
MVRLLSPSWSCTIGRRGVCGTQPDHFVFPACENGKIDPANPQKSWRTRMAVPRKAAGLKNLRFHDLRHHAITELAESQASEGTIMSVAGHVSRQMLEHYSHIRLDAKRLKHYLRGAKRGVTSQTTSQTLYWTSHHNPQVKEKIGRGERI